MRTSRWVAGLTVLAALGVGTASAVSPGPGARSTLDTIAQRGEVRVCSTGDYRPFTYRDPETGQWRGIDVDMAGDLARRLGVTLSIVPTTWETLVDDLNAGKCELGMGGVSVTLERATDAFYSKPYVRDGKTPITRCENVDRFQTLEQINRPGVRAIVNPGGTNEEFAEQHLTRATIVRHPDNNTIFEQIVNGHADLMITDAVETRWQDKQHPELCAVHPDRPFTFSEKAYLLPRGDVVLQEWVDQWLNLAINDGTYDRFARPWIG